MKQVILRIYESFHLLTRRVDWILIGSIGLIIRDYLFGIGRNGVGMNGLKAIIDFLARDGLGLLIILCILNSNMSTLRTGRF